MGELHIRGTVRSHKVFTTRSDPDHTRSTDLVNRVFTASSPGRLWVTDFTYVAMNSQFAYVAFVVDAFSRMIVGVSVDSEMSTPFVMKAIDQAVAHSAPGLDGLVVHSDAGSQYTSERFRQRLAEVGAFQSIGTIADAYDNALAETTIGLYKAELVHRCGPWRSIEHLEGATLNWVDWFNKCRVHGGLGYSTPLERDAAYSRRIGECSHPQNPFET